MICDTSSIVKRFHIKSLILSYFRKVFKRGKMDSYSGSEPRKFISFHLGKEDIGQPQQTSCDPEPIANPEQLASDETPAIESPRPSISSATEVDQEATQPQHSPGPSLVSRLFATDSSGSNESCETYITCKLNQLTEKITLETPEFAEFSQKESISEVIALTPSVQQYEYFQLDRSSHSQVTFLDSPKEAGTSLSRTRNASSKEAENDTASEYLD